MLLTGKHPSLHSSHCVPADYAEQGFWPSFGMTIVYSSTCSWLPLLDLLSLSPMHLSAFRSLLVFFNNSVLDTLPGTLADEVGEFTNTWCIWNPRTGRWQRHRLCKCHHSKGRTETLPGEGTAAERGACLGPVLLRASSLCCWKQPRVPQHTQECRQQVHKELSLLTILLLNCQRIASKAVLYSSTNNRWVCGASGLPT